MRLHALRSLITRWFRFQAQLGLVLMLVLGVTASVSSVSAYTLGARACVCNVEEGLGLP